MRNSQGLSATVKAFKDEQSKIDGLQPILKNNFNFEYVIHSDKNIIIQTYESLKEMVDYSDCVDV